MSRICIIMGKQWKPRFQPRSHTFGRQGNEAGKVRKKEMKGRPSLKGQEESVNERHIAMSPATRGGRRRCMKKRKVNIKNEKKNNTEYAKNHLNPDHSSGNASCATNEWPDYPSQPRPADDATC